MSWSGDGSFIMRGISVDFIIGLRDVPFKGERQNTASSLLLGNLVIAYIR